MKKLYFLFLLMSIGSFAQNVTITKVIESDCSDPFVKSVELYVNGTVDFSTEVVLNFMLNGKAWADNQIDVTGLGTQTDSFVYIVRDIALMQAEFPSITFNASNTVVTDASTNGDDGYQVVLNDVVVSQFGKTETDADDDTIWEHDDSVVSRKSGILDDGTWNETHWDYSGKNSLDNFTKCNGGDGIEAFLNDLGGTYPLGSGSGWTLSVDDNLLKSIGLYPNPIAQGSNFMKITSNSDEEMKVIVYDFLGKQLLKQNIKDNLIDISRLKTGAYFIKIYQANREISKKILVK